MKHSLKKTLALFLALCMIVLCAPLAFAAGGTDGNITWSYDDETATLYIDGEGGTNNYTFDNYRPEWAVYSNRAKNLVIGSGVTLIGTYAFYDFTALETVSLPDSLTQIYNYAFHNCTSLKSVTIPDSVTWVGIGVFQECYALEEVVISKNLTVIGTDMFQLCTSLKHVTIPGSVKSIGSQAFRCASLQTVTIGDGVETIDNYAFSRCSSLKSVVLPASVRTINMFSFGAYPMETVYYCGSEAQWDAIQKNENAFWLYDEPNLWYRERGEGEELNVVFYWGVDGTIKAIEDIGEVEYTAECKARIDEARKAYDRLSDYESTLVTNHQDLLDAEKAYSDLDAAATELAAAKEALSDLIGEARGYYDTLLEDEKYAQIADDLDTKLQQAEAILSSDASTLDEVNGAADMVVAALEAAKEQKAAADANTDEPETVEKPHGDFCFCYAVSGLGEYDNLIRSICAIISLVMFFLQAVGAF